jgi:hypothetical protein
MEAENAHTYQMTFEEVKLEVIYPYRYVTVFSRLFDIPEVEGL